MVKCGVCCSTRVRLSYDFNNTVHDTDLFAYVHIVRLNTRVIHAAGAHVTDGYNMYTYFHLAKSRTMTSSTAALYRIHNVNVSLTYADLEREMNSTAENVRVFETSKCDADVLVPSVYDVFVYLLRVTIKYSINNFNPINYCMSCVASRCVQTAQ